MINLVHGNYYNLSSNIGAANLLITVINRNLNPCRNVIILSIKILIY